MVPLLALTASSLLSSLLPCPLAAGWELIWEKQLPTKSATGQAIGGFSAIQLNPKLGSLLLLSDAPASFVLEAKWRGSLLAPQWQLSEPQPLLNPPEGPLDGEALVPVGQSYWMASEGRLGGLQPAALLELQVVPDGGSSGKFKVVGFHPLPEDWQPQLGRGLAPNQGPEALVALPGQRLLIAAERPLQQDPNGQLRLLLAQLGPKGLRYEPIGSPLAYSPEPGAAAHWGLTDLLALEPGNREQTGPLLALWRGYAEPQRWWSRLELLAPLALGTKSQEPKPPLAQWDLLAIGLGPDNWEAMAVGPSLADGRSTLLLASDDNFNPLQANRLALIAPKHNGCPPGKRLGLGPGQGPGQGQGQGQGSFAEPTVMKMTRVK
jgi:hypothetical protein